MQGGTAGDLITCRPFDASLELFQQGHLASLNDLPGMENFGDVAKSAWITDDGSDVFCVPMASVIHGFFYNKDKFDEFGLAEPTTSEEFITSSNPQGQWRNSARDGHRRPVGICYDGFPEHRSQLLEG